MAKITAVPRLTSPRMRGEVRNPRARYRRRAGRRVRFGRGARLCAGRRPLALARRAAFARFTVLARPTALALGPPRAFLPVFLVPAYLRAIRAACLVK